MDGETLWFNGGGGDHLAEDAAVFHGEDFDIVQQGVLKVGRDAFGAGGAGLAGELFETTAQTLDASGLDDGVEVDHVDVAVAVEKVLLVPHVCVATTHAAAEVVHGKALANLPAGRHIHTHPGLIIYTL